MFRKIGLQFAALAMIAMIFTAQGSAQYQKTKPDQTQDQKQDRNQADRDTRTGAKHPTTFHERAVEMNHAEIQLGHLAMEKTQDSRVKDYADMMARDHTQMLNRLQGTRETTSALGRTRDMGTDSRQKPADSIDPSDVQTDRTDGDQATKREKPGGMKADTFDRSMLTREHQRDLDRLENLSGAEFDREYISLMVREHRNAIQMFERETGMSATRSDRMPSTRPDDTANVPGDDVVDTKEIAREHLPTWRQHLSQAEQIQRQLKSGQR